MAGGGREEMGKGKRPWNIKQGRDMEGTEERCE